MLPLQPPEWYKQHPRPVNVQNNFDISIFQQGLRLTKVDHERLANDLTNAMKQGVNNFEDGSLELRNSENKNKVNIVLDTVISQKSAQYGWTEIDGSTVKE